MSPLLLAQFVNSDLIFMAIIVSKDFIRRLAKRYILIVA